MHTSKHNCIPKIDNNMAVYKEDKIKEIFPMTMKHDI